MSVPRWLSRLVVSASAVAGLAIPVTAVHAATVTLSATATANYDQWSASDPISKYILVSTNNGDSGYIHTDDTNFRQSFVFNGLSLPAGSVINSVAVSAVARRTGGSPTFRLLAEKGTSSGDRNVGSSQSPSNSYGTFTRTMSTNPFTSTAWTVNEINNNVRFGVEYSSGNPSDIRVTQMYVIVTYTAPVCGNSIITSNEGCDDGNTTNGDGCSSVCAVETGFQCSGTPSTCSHIQVCGDGYIDSPEACDDENITNGDGCSATCTVESGFQCNGAPSLCGLIQTCGNGDIEGTETCDDSNATSGDGCSSICAIESGFQCTSEPSICSFIPVCGDNILTSPEQCDDGNATSGDGCSATCTTESSSSSSSSSTSSSSSSSSCGEEGCGSSSSSSSSTSSSSSSSSTSSSSSSSSQGYATVTVRKITVNGFGEFTFRGLSNVGIGVENSFTLETDEESSSAERTFIVPVSPSETTFDLTEDAQEGWTLTSKECTYGEEGEGVEISNGVTVELAPGETATCEFVNTAGGSSSSSSSSSSQCFQQVCTSGPDVCVPGPQICTLGPQICIPNGTFTCTGEGESEVCTPNQNCVPGPDVCVPGPQVCTPGPQNCSNVPVSCNSGGGDGQQGSHHGNQTTDVALGIARFLFNRSNIVRNVAPGGFGGTDNSPLSNEEKRYLCSIQRTQFTVYSDFLSYYSAYVGQILGRDPATVEAVLGDPEQCEGVNAAYKPQLVAAAEPTVLFFVDKDNMPVTSNGYWNECFREEGDISGTLTYKSYMRKLNTNPETDDYGVPYPCGHYFSRNGSKEIWHLPFG